MPGREAVGRAWIVDFLGALDQPGRLLRRVFDRNDLVIFTVLWNAERGVTRIVLATTGRPPYASALTAPATVTYRTSLDYVVHGGAVLASTFLAFA
jgi:hypothetical protein